MENLTAYLGNSGERFDSLRIPDHIELPQQADTAPRLSPQVRSSVLFDDGVISSWPIVIEFHEV